MPIRRPPRPPLELFCSISVPCIPPNHPIVGGAPMKAALLNPSSGLIVPLSRGQSLERKIKMYVSMRSSRDLGSSSYHHHRHQACCRGCLQARVSSSRSTPAKWDASFHSGHGEDVHFHLVSSTVPEETRLKPLVSTCHARRTRI